MHKTAFEVISHGSVNCITCALPVRGKNPLALLSILNQGPESTLKGCGCLHLSSLHLTGNLLVLITGTAILWNARFLHPDVSARHEPPDANCHGICQKQYAHTRITTTNQPTAVVYFGTAVKKAFGNSRLNNYSSLQFSWHFLINNNLPAFFFFFLAKKKDRENKLI